MFDWLTQRKRSSLWFIYCLLILFLSGCAHVDTGRLEETGNNSSPKETIKFRFEDVPVPSSMTLDEDKSFIFETKFIRAGILVYRGDFITSELISFFKKRMPEYQWELISSFEHRDTLMTFLKDGWSCVIHIFPKGKVTIRVGPTDTLEDLLSGKSIEKH